MNRQLIPIAAIALLPSALFAAPPAPLPPLPTPQQITWQDNNFALLLPFGINTFTGKDVGTGQEDPKLFNPAKLDLRQWMTTAKENGFTRIILTAKGTEGFCLWPTKTTDFHAQGDLVRDFVAAARAAGLKPGLSFAFQDNHGGDDSAQLTELMTQYGPIDELRVDLSMLKKGTPPPTSLFTLAHFAQPTLIVQSNIGPDARWNGSTIGHGGEPMWALFEPGAIPDFTPTKPQRSTLNSGSQFGSLWMPAECPIFIRPHQYWEKDDDTKLETPDRLFSALCKSTGRNCVALVDVPPNTDGLIPDPDVQLLHTVHAMLTAAFKTDLAAGKPITASNSRDGYAASNAVDADPATYWCPDDNIPANCWLEVDLGQPTKFNIAAMREPISLGQRVIHYQIEYLDGDQWKSVATGPTPIKGVSIGHLKIERFDTVTAQKIRFTIVTSRACPLISQFSLYYNGK